MTGDGDRGGLGEEDLILLASMEATVRRRLAVGPVGLQDDQREKMEERSQPFSISRRDKALGKVAGSPTHRGGGGNTSLSLGGVRPG